MCADLGSPECRLRHVAVAKSDAVDVGDLLCLIEEGIEPLDPTKSLELADSSDE